MFRLGAPQNLLSRAAHYVGKLRALYFNPFLNESNLCVALRSCQKLWSGWTSKMHLGAQRRMTNFGRLVPKVTEHTLRL